MTPTETLLAARSLIEAGWNQYALTNGKGGYCLKAAIGLAAGTMVDWAGQVGYVRINYEYCSIETLRKNTAALNADFRATTLLRDHLPEGFNSIPVFNDHPETTREDVLAVLDKAISA